jgi:hypothetical protein
MPTTRKKPVKRAVKPGSLIKKLRKPLAPPTRVSEDERKYQRARDGSGSGAARKI